MLRQPARSCSLLALKQTRCWAVNSPRRWARSLRFAISSIPYDPTMRGRLNAPSSKRLIERWPSLYNRIWKVDTILSNTKTWFYFIDSRWASRAFLRCSGDMFSASGPRRAFTSSDFFGRIFDSSSRLPTNRRSRYCMRTLSCLRSVC
jgi:hypothetical protein